MSILSDCLRGHVSLWSIFLWYMYSKTISNVCFKSLVELDGKGTHTLSNVQRTATYSQNLEGAKLSRYGTISLLTLFLFPNNTTYLIDITTLGALAFTTPSSIHPDTTFKSILQDASIPKVFFDVRNDSDALFHHFQISLAGIIDLQLLELGSRVGGLDQKRTVCGLARCIKTDAQLTPAEKKIWETTKEKGGLLFAPEKGGRYEVFDERPLSKEMVDYCVQDVRFLPGLWNVYTKRLGDDGKWKGLIEDATLERVRDSQGKGYVPDSKMKVFGPWTKGPAPSRG